MSIHDGIEGRIVFHKGVGRFFFREGEGVKHPPAWDKAANRVSSISPTRSQEGDETSLCVLIQ